MNPKLLEKLNNCQFLCHSTTIEYAKEIEEKGCLENVYATVNQSNDFREGAKIYFLVYDIDEQLKEDSCVDEHTGKRFESEWNNHNQVFVKEADFCLNADLIKIEYD